jgi:hypothetical protein
MDDAYENDVDGSDYVPPGVEEEESNLKSQSELRVEFVTC